MPLSPDMYQSQTQNLNPDVKATEAEKKLMAKAWKARITKQSDYRQALREFLSCNFIQYGLQTEFITENEKRLASSIIDKIQMFKGGSYTDSLREYIQ